MRIYSDRKDQVKEIKGVKLLAAKVSDVDMNGLRDLGDQLKEKLGGGGGRPNMAQAGGKNPAGIDDALKAAEA